MNSKILKSLFQNVLGSRPYKLENKIYILTFHGLMDANEHHHIYRNFNFISAFKQHVNNLKKIHFLSLNELSEILESNNQIKKPMILLTFDDGYKNNLIAAEILQKQKKTATFFLSSGYIETNNFLWTVELSVLLLSCHPE